MVHITEFDTQHIEILETPFMSQKNIFMIQLKYCNISATAPVFTQECLSSGGGLAKIFLRRSNFIQLTLLLHPGLGFILFKLQASTSGSSTEVTSNPTLVIFIFHKIEH